MRRGPGWVRASSLLAIRQYEDEGVQWPTTYTIAADVYQIAPDADGNRLVSDTQHVAVKRALASLQRKGLIIGFRDPALSRQGIESQCYIWMTETGLSRWIEYRKNHAAFVARGHPERAEWIINQTAAVIARAREAGMKVD